MNNLKKLAVFAVLLIPACAGDEEAAETGASVDTGATETVTTPTTPTTTPTTPTGTTGTGTGTGTTSTGS